MPTTRFYNVLVSGDYVSERLNHPQHFIVTAWVGGVISVPVDFHVVITTDAYIDAADLHQMIARLFFGITPLLPHTSLPLTLSAEHISLEITDL